MTEFCLNTNKYLFSFTIFILLIMYYVYPQKNFAQVLPSILVVRVYKVYDVQYEMVNMKTRASGLTLKKEAQRLFGNGEILFTIYFRGSAISAGDWFSCTLP